jgi:hypothetical protein
MNYPLRCGRLDRHEPHDWSGSHYYGNGIPQSRWHCAGHVVIEGGYREQDDADDAAEERAIQERRESA